MKVSILWFHVIQLFDNLAVIYESLELVGIFEFDIISRCTQ